MLSHLLDRTLLPAAAGRPRSALSVRGDTVAVFAEARGAKVVRVDTLGAAPADTRFDSIFVGEPAARDALSALGGVAAHLEDGGHLVLHHGAGAPRSAALAALEGAGLTPMWHDGGLLGPAELVVARRPPERRPLSLTVGMISMNEEGAVGKVIDDIRKHCPKAEVLLVDSSSDATPQISAERGARVIRQFPPKGYGPAMTRLLYEATTDVIVTMDCDGTYPADRILDFHERIEAGADLVNGSRTSRRPEAMPLANYIANRGFAAVAGITHGFSTTDVHSGMRAYRTSMLRGIFVEERGLALPVELLIVPSRHGYRTEDVPIDYFERIGTTTLNRFGSTVGTFKRIANAAWTGGSAIARD